MNSRVRISFYSLMIALLALASAFTVIPARADDGAPPPPAAPSGPSTASTTTSVLSHVPAGTDIAVVDHNGRKIALASQEASHLVAAGDPIWCPLGVAPKNNAGGCSPAYSGFGFPGLSTWMFVNDPNKAGVIWIEASYQGSVNDVGMTSLTIDGSIFTNMANHSLALKGGWNGMPGSTVINAFDPSEFDASVKVIDWHAPISISDIVVTGVTVNSYEPYALSVQTDTGGITLNRVQVIKNYSGLFAGGAHLDTTGASLLHPAPVNVIDSVFSHNYGTGLNVQADGAVNIRNIAADFNGFPGAVYGTFIDNFYENPNQPVTFTGTNEFKSNFGTGLWIQSYGAVTLNNITAFNNNSGGAGVGVHIENNHDSTPSIVKLTGTNLFRNNGFHGLFILSNGNIYLNNITSINNAGAGAFIDNCLRPGSNAACATTAKSVTLTGINSFNYNFGGDGLDVFTSGAVAISQVTADHNSISGMYLDNCAYDSAILFNCTTLLPFNITLAGSGTFINNGSYGFYITTTGAVSLKNITAGFNGLDGGDIYNNYHRLAPRAVTIGGTNVFNGNAYLGLDVISYGAITVNNLTADDNGFLGFGGFGAYLDNEGFAPDAGGLGIPGATVITRQPVKLTGVNTFNHNYYNGLQVESVGAISLSNVTANNNGNGLGYDGLYLNNGDDWYPNFGPVKSKVANVTLSGFGFFESNGWNGLEVNSSGVVTLANLTSNSNFNSGAYIATRGDVAPQAVTIGGVNTFYKNGFGSGIGAGLYLQNDGKITISNLSANSNQSYGAFLDNYTWKWPNKFLGVTLTGFNTFENNAGLEALNVYTDGSAVISHVNTDLNTNTGIYVVATRNITLTCANVFGNATGIYLFGDVITLTGVHTYFNTTNENLTYTALHRFYSCP